MIQNEESITTVGRADLEAPPVVGSSALEVEDDELALPGRACLAFEGVTAKLLHGPIVDATRCRRLGSGPGGERRETYQADNQTNQ